MQTGKSSNLPIETMSAEVNVLKRAVDPLTTLLSGFDLSITFKNDQAQTMYDTRTGKPVRMILPILPGDADAHVIAAFHGYIDHEVGHVLYTDISDFHKELDSRMLKTFFNIVEDIRIERCMCERFVLYGSEVFDDVRLVGVLPQSVAKFGGETDNYMWPRHNSDFALFRVYAAPDGTPAPYAAENVPYATADFLHVSREGYDEGDFALSLGYPMRTARSATSSEIWRTRHVINEPIVAIRGRMLEALQQRMRADREVNLTYYEEFNAQANEYKNFLGMNEWIDRQGLVARKRDFERQLVEWTRREGRYPGVARYLTEQERAQADSVESRAVGCLLEGFHRGSQMLNFVMAFGPGLETLRKGGVNTGMSRKDYLHNVAYYYGRMVPEVDREMTALGMELVRQQVPAEFLPSFYTDVVDSLYGGNIRRFVDTLYARSIFADSARIRRWLDTPWCSYDEDPAVKVEHSVDEMLHRLRTAAKSRKPDRQALQDYQAARIACLGGAYYPDADRTLRFSYGRVRGLDTRGFQTRFSEIAAKDDGVNPDYRRTDRLRELDAECREGALADTPLCFITDGDVTGGNSGSPMLSPVPLSGSAPDRMPYSVSGQTHRKRRFICGFGRRGNGVSGRWKTPEKIRFG